MYLINKTFIKITLLTSIVAGTIFPAISSAKIHDVKHMSEVAKERLHPGDILVFDIDNTLVTTKQTLASDQWFRAYWGVHAKQGASSQEVAKKVIPVYNAAIHLTDVKLLEPSVIKLIDDAKELGVKVIALTSRNHEVITPTQRQLESVGIQMDKGVDYYQNLNGRDVFHKSGVIYCNGSDKGKCLSHYLHKHRIFPKKIVFVDDHQRHVESIERLSNELGVAYSGYRYGFMDDKIKEINMQVANAQLERMKILSDLEAQKRISLASSSSDNNKA